MKTKKSGIYSIVNNINGKSYIGSAINIINRWNTHKTLLNHGNHHNIHLQNAWNKYGESSFSFVILLLVENKEDLLIQEQKLIDEISPEYNICRVAGSALGRKMSAETKRKIGDSNRGKVCKSETKQKISKSKKGKPVTDEFRQKISRAMTGRTIFWKSKVQKGLLRFYAGGGKHSRSRAVNQYSKSNNFIQRFENAVIASKVVGIHSSAITKCSNGKLITAGGYIWKHDNDV